MDKQDFWDMMGGTTIAESPSEKGGEQGDEEMNTPEEFLTTDAVGSSSNSNNNPDLYNMYTNDTFCTPKK